VLPGVNKEAMITLPNAAWVVRVNAPAADVAQVYRAILSLGITLAALLYICSAMWLIFRRRAMDLERANGALQSEMRMRERAEQTVAELNRDLQRRLSEFETLVDVIPVGIAVSQDPDCREIWINPALARIMGTARDANISKSGPDADKLRFRFLHDGEDVPVDELPMQRVARTGLEISGEELDIEREDGQIVRTLAYTSPLFDEDGRVRGVLNACVDITDRKRAEQERSELLERERMARLKAEAAFAALEASRASFQRLIESDVIGVIVADSRRVVDCNEYFLSLLGYTRAEATGKQIRWPDIIPPEYRAEYGRQMRQLSAEGRFGAVEIELLRRDGGRVPVALGGARINPEADGRCVGFVLDLSKLRELERRVQRAEKFKSLALMAGGVAHDFNNLLTGILGNAALALDLLPADSQARTFVGRSVAASNRAAELIAQLLAYTGRTFYSPVTVNLSAVVAGMEAAIRDMAPETVEIRFDLAADLPSVHAGVSEVQRVVRNLILNAVEAARDDRIVIEVKTEARDLSADEISGLYPDQDLLAGTYVSLVVRDTGCGIREEDVSKVFDPFFTTKFVGRGLGLSTVYGIVRGHHGGIRVDSSVESGTHIEVLLPSQATAPVNRMAAIGASTAIGGVHAPEHEQV
jgi:PAS domain S-box-containing protein